jgi:hypothetical protein
LHRVLAHEETGDSITSTIVSDGVKNTVYLVSGTIKSEDDSVFDLIDTTRLEGKPRGLRIDGLMFTVESGLKLFLKYRDQPYIIPLEGRTKLDLGWVGGIQGHEIDMICQGTGSFFLVIDISKMGA